MIALQRLARVSPDTMSLQELAGLPPGSAMKTSLAQVAEGRVNARTLLAAYTECVRRTLSTRIDGHPAPTGAQNVRGEMPGRNPALEYTWSCTGPEDGGWYPFSGSVGEGEKHCFDWHPEQHTWRHADGDANEDDATFEELLNTLFFDPPKK